MKKYIISLLSIGLCMVLLTSCLENYLDKAPEAGLVEKDVFTKYENFIKYFNTVYTGNANRGYAGTYEYSIRAAYPMWLPSVSDMAWEGFTPLTDPGYLAGTAHFIKSASMSQANLRRFCYGSYPILSGMFMAIRTCNTTLKNINMLTDATQADIDDLIAQAHFVRAYAHFELVRLWGGMPYITKIIGPEDQWDIPRLSANETLKLAAADFDTAVVFYQKAGRMRRDTGPGQVGHLNHPDQGRPNGVAASALKSRALLYAASSLNNKLGVTDWQEAAKAGWEAIQIAGQYEYALLSAADYTKNVIGTAYSNEQLWAWYIGLANYRSWQSIIAPTFQNFKVGSGHAVAQLAVDMFETKWGDPLNTQAERDAATALGHYNEQDPYANREPRFYIDIIYNQCPIIGWGKCDIYYEIINGVPVYSYHLDQSYSGPTSTGYYERKHWGGQSVLNQITVQFTDPIIRLGELYLNYAEAANEAYGPNTPAPGASMTAVQAINKIRTRIGHSDVLPQFTATKEAFRPRIQNERNVELMFEGPYFFDIRRWKIAPAVYGTPMMGVDIEKVPVSATYPTGFKYTRRPIPDNRQVAWKEAMYYLQFMDEDNYKMKNFKPNPIW